MLRQTPQNAGVTPTRSRWTLALLQKHAPESTQLSALSLSGIWRRLRAWKIGHKQGRLHLHSPDPEYCEKASAIRRLIPLAREHKEQITLLFGDEAGFYRQPLVGRAWHPQGKSAGQAEADLSPRSNCCHRILGALDAVTGQVTALMNSKASVPALCRWLEKLRTVYGVDRRLILVWDNWPVHKHPRVEAMLLKLRIEVVWLPTYSPWLNPIEKLWRMLRQEVLSLHRHSEDWEHVKENVQQFLRRFEKCIDDDSGSDKSGSDKSGSDKSGSDKSGSDKSGSDKSGSDREVCAACARLLCYVGLTGMALDNELDALSE